VNDVLATRFLDLQPDGFEFSVYDRWGQQVFSSNNPNTRWDGVDAPDGVYFWRLIAKVLPSGESVQRSGSVTIVR
jgi:hypothetical protein